MLFLAYNDSCVEHLVLLDDLEVIQSATQVRGVEVFLQGIVVDSLFCHVHGPA